MSAVEHACPRPDYRPDPLDLLIEYADALARQQHEVTYGAVAVARLRRRLAPAPSSPLPARRPPVASSDALARAHRALCAAFPPLVRARCELQGARLARAWRLSEEAGTALSYAEAAVGDFIRAVVASLEGSRRGRRALHAGRVPRRLVRPSLARVVAALLVLLLRVLTHLEAVGTALAAPLELARATEPARALEAHEPDPPPRRLVVALVLAPDAPPVRLGRVL